MEDTCNIVVLTLVVFGCYYTYPNNDYQILSEIIDNTDSLAEAVHTFSKKRAIESKKLVTISRELDRPGK